MKLLLDTHILLWAAAGTLSPKAKKLVADHDNDLYFSPISIWEIGIKKSLGRSDFIVDPDILYRGLLDNLYAELPVSATHALVAANLPPIHKDPFDRMLLAQAKCEGMALLTSDAILGDYKGPVVLVPA